jgi:hypothetical protein
MELPGRPVMGIIVQDFCAKPVKVCQPCDWAGERSIRFPGKEENRFTTLQGSTPWSKMCQIWRGLPKSLVETAGEPV